MQEEKLKTQSEPQPEPKVGSLKRGGVEQKAFVALEELLLEHCSLRLPLATC